MYSAFTSARGEGLENSLLTESLTLVPLPTMHFTFRLLLLIAI
jgi:hypothetical protein